MREIIFKAKRLDNGEWVFGEYSRYENSTLIGYYQSELTEPENNHYETKGYTHEVDPETVCQFTGLTDKNGVKIWENEWLYATVRSAVFHNYQGKVIFYNGSFLLHAIDPETGLFNNIDDAKPLSDYYELQVINNPELLNQ